MHTTRVVRLVVHRAKARASGLWGWLCARDAQRLDACKAQRHRAQRRHGARSGGIDGQRKRHIHRHGGQVAAGHAVRVVVMPFLALRHPVCVLVGVMVMMRGVRDNHEWLHVGGAFMQHAQRTRSED